MGVPVISSNVGGQKELIDETVGIIVPCMQKEKDVKITKYQPEEINNYVVAVDKLLENLDSYKRKCRAKVLDGFTINNMQQKMSENIISIFNYPNGEKIESGRGLAKNISVAKELNVMFLQENARDFKWECGQYNIAVYGDPNGTDGSRLKAFGEKHWGNPLYRGLIGILSVFRINKLYKIIRGNQSKE
jgi:hypothetical protein